MKRTRKNNKGFTLIELLAVIVILAILMTLAVTSMSGYIRKAKKDTFVTTANQYLNSIRYSVINGDYEAPAPGACTVISMELVQLESGNKKSTYGKLYDATKSFVVIYNSGTSVDTYDYYLQMIDADSNGFDVLKESELTADRVKEKSAAGTTIIPTDGATTFVPYTGVTCSTVKVYQ